MIHYHGGPVFPVSAAIKLWSRRHAMISFAYPEQLPLAAECCQSFALDNGAFTAWKQGKPITDWLPYVVWVKEWHRHPGFDWAVIPDVVEGSEADNDALIRWWTRNFGNRRIHERPIAKRGLSVPVWHLHESTDRLRRLALQWPRVAFGSSEEFAEIGTLLWWGRVSEAMAAICDPQGRPISKIHLLRGLDPTITSHIPASSADSVNAGRNICQDTKWSGRYQPLTVETRALVMADRIEHHATAARWSGSAGIQKNLELVG